MKFKGFTGVKRCADGDTYRFKKGVAIVPGVWFMKRPLKITLKEFKELNGSSEST